MVELTSPQVVRQIMSQHGLAFKKGFGQNFLIDASVPQRIAKLAGIGEDYGVLEIGPGIGTLTQALATRAKKVVAVEVDRDLIGALSETVGEFPNVKIICGDILKMDINCLIEEEFQGMPVVCAANLPYYITSPIVTYILEANTRFESLTFMIQQEVAERFCAEAGGRDSGAITYFIRYYAEPEILFPVPKTAFLPAPKVDSAVIRLALREKPPVEPKNPDLFWKLIRASFNQRRKTLVNGISNAGITGKEKLAAVLEELGFSASIRGERLTMEDFCRISDRLSGD